MSVELQRAHQAVTSQLRQTMVRTLRVTWAASMMDLSEQSAALWVRAAVPIITAARMEMISTEAAFMAMMLGTDTPRLGEDVRAYPRPVDALIVYNRPVVTARATRAAGWSREEALRRGLNRATSIATTDLQLAKTHATRAILENAEGVVGYRRVVTGNKTCGLCLAASTRRYNKAELMPLHPGCSCDVSPLIGTEDPGQVINSELLDDLKRQGVEPVSTVIYQHGEYGPTLAIEGQHLLRGDDPADRADVVPPTTDEAA